MKMKEPLTVITTWVKNVLPIIILILMVVLLSSCEDNNVPTHSKKNEVSADKTDTKNKTQKDSLDKSNQGDVEIYAGPGTDFYCEGKIGLSDIKKVVLIDHDWVEVIYKDSQHGYVRKDTIKEIDISGAPVLANSIPATAGENKYLQRVDISYRLSGDIDLVEDMETLQKSSFVERGNIITVVVPFLLKENKYQVIGGTEKEQAYWLIEANTDRGKERAYVGTRDLFDLDNPLKDFSSVKENNLKLELGADTFYSASEDAFFRDDWKTIDELSLSHTEWDFWEGFLAVATSSDISLEDIESDVVNGTQLQLPTISRGKKTYTNSYTSIGNTGETTIETANAVLWLIQNTLTFLNESKKTQSFHINLQECNGEKKIVIYTGSPIESVQGGKYYGKNFSLLNVLLDSGYPYLSALDAEDNTIRGLDPSFTGEKRYSMDIKFAKKGKSDSPYGTQIVIDKEGNAYGSILLHQGTRFTVCYDGKALKDITQDIESYLFRLDKKTSDLLLNMLEESGFEIIKREAVQAEEEHPEATNSYVNMEYMNTITALLSKYGSLRIVQGNGEWQNEANGLCYLNLIDFTGDGNDELFAVCKNDDEDHYTGFIYTLNNGKAELIYENPQIEYNTAYEYDIVYMGYTKDTGFIFGTGWDAPDIDDRTFYWYKDGNFEPVYRSKGYYDDRLEEEVIEEELKIVDIFDDEHIDELWDSFPRVTLRTMGDEDENGDLFTSYNLQIIIDDALRKIGADLKDLPSSITFSEEKLNEISQAAIYHCIETDIDKWIPDVKDTEIFWDEMCFYCDFTYWIYSANYPRVGEDGLYQLIPNELLRNAAYALYKDFDGNLPTIDDNIWRAMYYDDMSTGITVGDDAPFIITSKNYQQNEDGTIDAEYVTEYWDGSSAGTYKVHFEPNSHYNEVDAGVTYYYSVSSVERIGKASVLEDNNSNNSSTGEYQEVINEYRSAYDDFELYQENSSAFMEKYPLVNVNALIEPYLSSIDLTFSLPLKT